MIQLESARQENTGLDRREFSEGTIEIGLQLPLQQSALSENTPQQAGEELAVGPVKAFAVEQMRFNRCLVVTTHQRLVEALQDEFAGQSTG